jgi:hypothetical protein
MDLMSRIESTARWLGRWLGIVFVFMLTLEVAARLDDAAAWGAPFLRNYSAAELVVWDSLGVRNKPGAQFEKWKINSSGFRGPEVEPTSPAGSIRVAILGASESFGLFESEGHEYPARLRSVLDSIAPGRFEVINASMAGLGLPTMASYFKDFVAPFEPDLVVVYPSPSFYLEVEPPRPLRPRPTPSPGGRAGGNATLRGLLPRSPEARLARKARLLLRRFIPPRIQSLVREAQSYVIRRRHDPEWLWDSVPRDRIEAFETDLQRLVDEIHTIGAEPVLVTHTNRLRKPATDYTAEDRHHALALLVMYPRASIEILASVDEYTNAAMRQLSGSAGVFLIDVDGQIPASGQYFADYAHFTDEGAGLMARILARELVAMVGPPDELR